MKRYVLGALLAAFLLPVLKPARPVFSRQALRTASPGSSFTLFETGQVRPLAFSAGRKLLFAVNTPDNRLEIFSTPDTAAHSPANALLRVA